MITKLRVSILHCAICQTLTNIDQQDKMLSLQDKLLDPISIAQDLPSLQAQLCHEQEIGRIIIKTATNRRKLHLEERAYILFLRGDTAQENELNKLAKAEETKKMFSKLRSIQKDSTTLGFSCVGVPIDPTQDLKNSNGLPHH